MIEQHPIIPSPDLLDEWYGDPATNYQKDLLRAAQWGADQELELCCEWLTVNDYDFIPLDLRAARRPKPPSLKQQALEDLNLLVGAVRAEGIGIDETVIRRALEALPDD
jgi:hypothetical protein